MAEINRDIELVIEGEDFRSGTTTGRRLVPTVVDGGDEGAEWVDLAQHAIRKYRTGEGIRHSLDGEGDRLTLGDLLDRNGLTVDDLERERRLRAFDVTNLSLGNVVEIRHLDAGNPGTVRRGVVRDIRAGDEWLPARAKLTWDGRTWSSLENTDGTVRVGRSNMMSEIHDLRVLDPDEIDEDLQRVRDDVLASAELDADADACEVTVEKTWQSSAEGGHDDHHATVTVDGPMLDAPVSVHCRNLFDAGWTASVEADLEGETEAVVLRAARNNSPIPTHIRT